MLDLLIDLRYWLLLLTVLVWAWFFWALKRNSVPAGKTAGASPRYTTRRVAMPPKKPADIAPLNRTSTGGSLAPAIEAGIAEHQVRGTAATAKLASQSPSSRSSSTDNLDIDTEDDSRDASHAAATIKDDTFSGEPADVATAPRTPTSPMQRSERLSEIGFHHPIESDKIDPSLLPQSRTATPVPDAAPAAPAAEAAPTPSVAPKPRTQTAELDDILKRIDRVLSESPAPATEAPKLPPAPPATRPTEKLDPADVLKRIDDALAEGHGGRASQATMPRPGWADEAKRAATELNADAKPAVAQPPRKSPGSEVPDWAKADVQDDDLPPKDERAKGDGKGDAPGQQKLF